MRAGRELLLPCIVIALLATACAAAVTPVASTKLKVVTTVSPITNIIYNVGGNRIDLTGIIPEGTDSRTFEPAPSTAALFATADVVFVNGLHLEEPTRKLAAANLKSGAEIVILASKRSRRINTSTTSRFRSRPATPTRTCG